MIECSRSGYRAHTRSRISDMGLPLGCLNIPICMACQPKPPRQGPGPRTSTTETNLIHLSPRILRIHLHRCTVGLMNLRLQVFQARHTLLKLHTPPPPTTDSHSTWNQTSYPALSSPPPNGAIASPHAAPEPVGAAKPYAPQLDQNATPISAETPSWQPSPLARRDSQYLPSAPPGPSAPDTHSPEQAQSAPYSTGPPAGVPASQQPTGYPPQSYYYQPQAQPSYPMATGQPGAYPNVSQVQPPASHQPAPVEESLIEL
ncbi:hypothetical protein N7470_004300 [Penicillium chermesinum]|nr:hypothetical protein N7470_004300 [Penicillium chermesinum]